MSTVLRNHLQAIRDEHGTLTPALVVDVARNPAHDAVAGEKWRLEQAGQLLRVTFKPIPSKPHDLRAFVAVKGEDTPTSEYVPTGEALADPFTRELLLRQMRRDWQTFKRRYDHMAEFAAFAAAEIGEQAS